MSKHSPKPWLYRGKSDSVHEQCETHPYGRQIFRFVEDEAPSYADLDLILAAPDLLEALESIIKLRDDGMSNDYHLFKDAVDVARLAVGKAKGDVMVSSADGMPPPNCRQRLAAEGKPYPRSSCAACGQFSPKWRECDAALGKTQK